MSATTKDKLEFVHAMARHTRATLRQCEALMRYAATLQRLAEDDCNGYARITDQERADAKQERIKVKVMEICCEADCAALFSSDPRGTVLKIRVPDGFTNDFGGEGICVPS